MAAKMTPFDQIRIWHCILPVIEIEVSILTFLGKKNTFSSFSKFKMAAPKRKSKMAAKMMQNLTKV